MTKLYTIGHSNRTFAQFADLLRNNGVTAVADVRSVPSSRHARQFNRDELRETLEELGIAYVFLGNELGARREEASCYIDGKARYELIEKTPLFQSGLDRIRRGVETYCVALMCAERDPLTCHRSILVARSLATEFDVAHIVSKDIVESHHDLEERLLSVRQMQERSLFLSRQERLEEAYARQGEEIAFVKKDSTGTAGASHVGN